MHKISAIEIAGCGRNLLRKVGREFFSEEVTMR